MLETVARWVASPRYVHEVGPMLKTIIESMSTRPQTLAYALTDSPAGLAGWIVEKWQAWSDCGAYIESRFTKDELLTTISLYWFTETIHSSTRLYYENAHNNANRIGGRIDVPSGYAVCRWLTQTRDELARDSNRALDRVRSRCAFRGVRGTGTARR